MEFSSVHGAEKRTRKARVRQTNMPLPDRHANTADTLPRMVDRTNNFHSEDIRKTLKTSKHERASIDPRFNESTPRNLRGWPHGQHMMKQHVELDWTFGLAWKIIMFILIVCTCGIGPQAVFTYPDRSGSVVWAAYCAFCATWPHLRGFNCSINGTNSRALSVDQLKSGRRRVTVWTGRQWS
ncbi:hypothetical protein T03_3179 [Trichinella britovi]|uniref:Uncharacterized protein n=4 Tax=Trichinella TaxID=6333 RepID=A0A0V1DBU7_TRIBR|nr:hypothetical protein T05_16327 [Trichinella murrelli]KRY18287.1 hypothetical protein T12_12150 [Trichinella patagoniensis]KRY58959.1 hypothetical protein T03_3179 [Trichinella britovi]